MSDDAAVASNAKKTLLGLFWGTDAHGIYDRAYRLINLKSRAEIRSGGEVYGHH